MPQLSDPAREMPPSGIRAAMEAVWQIDGDVIGLHAGEPSFPTPQHVLDEARHALDRRATRYVPNAGIPELRAALAEKVTRRNAIKATPEQIIVSAGGTQALLNALALVVSAGDEVLVPNPGWPNFGMMVHMLQAIPVPYTLRAENRFQPYPADLSAAVTDRTVAIILNSPSNPLGTVVDAGLTGELVAFAERHDLWLISDECYDAITFEEPHVSPASVGGSERILSCFSFSKTYAMTGMRVGYAVVPAEVAPVAAELQEAMIGCVSAPAQWGALAALRGPQDVVEAMRRTYQQRRDLTTTLLDELGQSFVRPQGAFYLWLDVGDKCGSDVRSWALRLLHEKRVAVAPGTAFGPEGEGWVRISLATDTAALLEGCRRIAEFE
jgi:aspartate aminotransferase